MNMIGTVWKYFAREWVQVGILCIQICGWNVTLLRPCVITTGLQESSETARGVSRLTSPLTSLWWFLLSLKWPSGPSVAHKIDWLMDGLIDRLSNCNNSACTSVSMTRLLMHNYCSISSYAGRDYIGYDACKIFRCLDNRPQSSTPSDTFPRGQTSPSRNPPTLN